MNIFHAAQLGDLDRIRAVVEQDAGVVHATSGPEFTPLLWAADNGHVEVARYLLDHGAAVNHRDNSGWTALHIACLHDFTRFVSLLLQRGADVTLRGGLGDTPLISAADDGQDGVVRVLVEHGGSDVDAVDAGGMTSCHWAAYRGHAVVLRLLLEAGADPLLRDAHGNTASDRAAQSEAQESEELVIEEQECFIILQDWHRAYMLRRIRCLRDASSTPPSTTP